MSPSTPGPATPLAVRLELREDRPPQAFLPGNLLDIQHGSSRHPKVDYEQVFVRRNAPRWIRMLEKHGFLEEFQAQTAH